MLKQQTVSTSLGNLTVSSLTLASLRQLDTLFQDQGGTGFASVFRFLPVIHASLRQVHQDLTIEQLEGGLTLEDFNALMAAVLEVSGIKKAKPEGEDQPAAAVPA